MPRWLNLGIIGSATWPDKETCIDFCGRRFVLKPATADTEQSIHVELTGLDEVEALSMVNRLLSIISWCSDQPMQNLYGWSGNPVPASVPRRKRAIGSTTDFTFARRPESDSRAQLALALYREGRTINSIPFQYLSYFKILNIFWDDRYVRINGERRNAIVEGIRATLAQLEDAGIVQRLKALEGDNIDVPSYLYKDCRNAIAHAYADPIIDPDDVSALRRLSEDLPIIKAIAEYLMDTRLGISRYLFSRDTSAT